MVHACTYHQPACINCISHDIGIAKVHHHGFECLQVQIKMGATPHYDPQT